MTDPSLQTELEIDAVPTADDDAIRALVKRLSRPDRAGGQVIERAAVLAAGIGASAVLDWIAAHGGRPERPPVKAPAGGLQNIRTHGRDGAPPLPLRYVFPPGALD